MRNSRRLPACAISLLALIVCSAPAGASSRALTTLTNLPLSFESNRDASSFIARGPGYKITLSREGATIADRRGSVSIRLAGANLVPAMQGLEQLPGKSNHFTGPDPARWRLNVPQYAKVRYREVYPGVDLVFYGRSQRLEYDFLLAPGANPDAIRLEFDGAAEIHLDRRGDLLVRTSASELRQHRPRIYQEVYGKRRAIQGGYVLLGGRTASFRIGEYDRRLPLVIDPVLTYATFLGGGNMDMVADAAVDASGNLYAVGGTVSANFPTTPGAIQRSFGGAMVISEEEGIGIGDAFVAKISPDGASVLYSTYLGGSDGDIAVAIAVDASGNAYVTGLTRSGNFPVTEGALQSTYRGGKPWSDDFPIHFGDAFVVKLDPNGAMIYSTFLGGSGSDGGTGIAVDAGGNAYVTGVTTSSDFPVSQGAVQPTYVGGTAVAPDMPIDFGDAFVTKLNSGGTAILYSTYLGGSKAELPFGIAVDNSGSVYIAGTTWSKDFPVSPGAFRAAGGDADVFVAKLNETGTALLYASSFGGRGADECYGVAVDAGGNAYVSGRTRGMDFPVTSNAYQTAHGGNDDAFLAKLNAAGTELIYATYLGGKGAEICFRPAVDAAGNAYITGDTRSPDFPTTPDALQRQLSGQHSVFVAKFDPSGSALNYSTLFPGKNDSKAMRVMLDPGGNVYLAGLTSSSDFPVTAGAAQARIGGMYDGFVLKISDPGAPAPAADSSVADSSSPATRGRKLLRWLKSRFGVK